MRGLVLIVFSLLLFAGCFGCDDEVDPHLRSLYVACRDNTKSVGERYVEDHWKVVAVVGGVFVVCLFAMRD